MSNLNNELPNLLFKKYSGVVDTNSSFGVSDEPPVLAYPKIIPSVQIYAQQIPNPAPTDLTQNFIAPVTGISNNSGYVNLSTGQLCINRQISTAYPYITKYTKLKLVNTDTTRFAFRFAGTGSTINLLTSTNLLSQIIPYYYDTAGSYQYFIYIWQSSSSSYISVPSSDTTNPWVLDIDAGYLRFFGNTSPDPDGLHPPLVTFWRYEGLMGLESQGGVGSTGPTGPASYTFENMTIIVGNNTNNKTTIGYSYNGITWSTREINTPTTSSNINCSCIAKNNSIWLIGCSGEGIAYSSDGLQWNYSKNAKTLFSSENSNSIVWGSYQWVATANTFMATSQDGITWFKSSKPKFPSSPSIDTTKCKWKTVAYNGYMWVSLGNYDNQYGISTYSLDGKNWIAYTKTDISGFSTIACNSSIWLAGCKTSTTSKILSSIDGVNWSPTTLNTEPSFDCKTLFTDGTVWLAGGENGIAISDISGNQWYVLTPGILIIIDGITVTTSSSTNFKDMKGKSINSICWNGLTWVCAGSSGLYYSYNAYDWYESNSTIINPVTYNCAISRQPQLADIIGTSTIKSVTEKFSVMVGSSDRISYTYDGIKWFNNLNALGTFCTLEYNGFMWVAGGTTLVYSYDGIAWTQCTGTATTYTQGSSQNTDSTYKINTVQCPEITYDPSTCSSQPTPGTNSIITNKWTDISFKDSLWVAIGYSSIIATSTDGIVWSINQDIGSIYQLNTIASSDTMYIAAGQGVSVYSYDGNYWIVNEHDCPMNINSIAYNGTLWVMVGVPNTTPSGPYIMYSKNGIEWTTSCITGTATNVVLNTIEWNGILWITGGSSLTGPIFYYSIDAKTWGNCIIDNLIQTTMTTIQSAIWNGTNWLAIGQNISNTNTNTIMSSDGIIWTLNTNTNLIPNSIPNKILSRNKIIFDTQLDNPNVPLSPIFTLPADRTCAEKYLRERPNYRLRVQLTEATYITLPFFKPRQKWFIQNLTGPPNWPFLTIKINDLSNPPGLFDMVTMTCENTMIEFFDTYNDFNFQIL
jgi:hypothetical protein